MREPKILIFDTEFHRFDAGSGLLLCMSWKEPGKKVQNVKISDSPRYGTTPLSLLNDKWLVKQISDVLSDADMWVTWYGKRCDVPYINSRLLKHGYKPLPPVKHIDGWETARKKLRLFNNRLATVAEFFGADKKTPVSLEYWNRALAGHQPSLNYIVKHCDIDVEVLEQVYNKILPLIYNHPSRNAITGDEKACPKCGVRGKMQKRGWSYAQVMRTRRLQCTACGSWLTGERERVLPVGSIKA